MMNNKGFTLTEILAALVIISIALIVVSKEIGKTLSITKQESYDLMKQNIAQSADIYIKECNKTEKCGLKWNNNKTKFKAKVLKENGYYVNLKSPIDNKDLSECLTIEVTKNNGIVISKIIDNCY